jgi:TonB family protein
MLSLLVALALASEGTDVLKPQWIFPPDYPSPLLARRAEGTVEFRLTFDAAGRVSACDIVKTSGIPLLDATACRLAVRRARAKSDEARVQLFRHTWRLPAER